MQVKTDLGKTSISYIGPIIWNKILSVGINPDTSECVFSKSLKHVLELIYSKPTTVYVGTLDVLNSNYASLPLWIYVMV